MISCEDFSHTISDYLDGETSKAHDEAMREHMAACPSCSQKFRQMRVISDSLRALPKVKVSTEFNEKLRQRISFESVQTHRRSAEKPEFMRRFIPGKPVVVTIAAAAMLAFALVLVDSIMLHDDTPTVVPRLQIPPMPGTQQPAGYPAASVRSVPLQMSAYSSQDSMRLLGDESFFQSNINHPLLQPVRDQRY